MKGPPNRMYNTPADLVKSSLDICCLLSREGRNTVCCLQVFVATNPTDVCLQWVHSAYGVELWCTLLPSYQLYFLALTAQNSCENPKVVLWKKTLKHFKTRTSVLLYSICFPARARSRSGTTVDLQHLTSQVQKFFNFWVTFRSV